VWGLGPAGAGATDEGSRPWAHSWPGYLCSHVVWFPPSIGAVTGVTFHGDKPHGDSPIRGAHSIWILDLRLSQAPHPKAQAPKTSAMATFPNTFRSDSARIHNEHQQLLMRLADLAVALEALGPNTLSVDPLGAGRLRRSLARLEEFLTAHFRREETTVLDAVVPVSPELAEFSRQMRLQHQGLAARVKEFAGAVARLEAGNHGQPPLRQVQQAGEELTHDLATHIALEEEQLDGFL